MREAGNEDPIEGNYDFDKMFAALRNEGVGSPDVRGGKTGFTLFGGEPLLLPLKDLERMFSWGKGLGVPISIQTNASLITDRHLDLFVQFGVSVGVSIDGPKELNRLRASETIEATDRTTDLSNQAFLKLLARGIGASLIVTLSTVNAGADVIKYLSGWIVELYHRGLRHVNFHLLEVDGDIAQYVLPPEEQIAALRKLRSTVQSCAGLRAMPFDSMRALLIGEDEQNVECIWHACDPYTTNAVRGIDGQGNRGNCGRTNKDGVPYVKGSVAGYERQLALYLTPQAHGGCQECRFFFACKGECPGTGEGSEWRSRTTHCASLMAIFADLEQELIGEGKTPLSSSLMRPAIEAALLRSWSSGQNVSIGAALRQGATGSGIVPHGDVPHGDVPHGDHTDAERPVRTHGDHGDAEKARS